MSIFDRPENTYDTNDSVVIGIDKDEASPVKRIAALIPNGTTVLDVGCGNGVLARYLKFKSREVVIDGIEPSAHAAEISQPFYRSVMNGQVEDCLVDVKEGAYDFVVLADVVEHLSSPFDTINALVSSVGKKCTFIFSVPNVAFGAARLSMLKGNFNYSDSGIFERTHLKFYTISTLRKLFSELGLHIWTEQHLRRNFMRSPFSVGEFLGLGLVIPIIPKDRYFHVYQYVLVARPGVKNREVKKRSFGRYSVLPTLDYWIWSLMARVPRLKLWLRQLKRCCSSISR